MKQKSEKLYTSALLMRSDQDLEQRFEKKLNDLNSFNNPINNIKELITCFEGGNNKSKKKPEKCKTLITILKSFDTFVIIATTSSSITLSLTGIGLIEIPITTGIANGLTISDKLIYEIIINKYNKYKEQ